MHSEPARKTIIAALVGALVPFLFLVMIGVLFVRRRRRRLAAAGTELAHRFVGIPLDSHVYPRRGETNEALRVGKTRFHRITRPRGKGAPPLRAGENHRARTIFMGAEQTMEPPSGDPNARARQAQLQLAEENLALRMRIREMEGLATVHSSGRRASAPESDAPPDYDDAGIVL